MKKIITTICLVVAGYTLTKAQLPNSGFESWNQGLPTSWFAALIPGYTIVEQSADAHGGSFAVKLNVVNINGNPYGSSISTGSAGNITTPISYVPASINFWYKLSSISGDQLSVIAFVYSAGNLVALGSTQLNGTAAYTNASYNLINLTGGTVADSIQISFLINNPAGATHIGSSATIDDVSAPLTSGINTLNKNDVVTIAPVPAKDVLQVNLQSVWNYEVTCTIYDTKGNKIKSTAVQKNQSVFSIDVSEIPAGTYVLQLAMDGNSLTKVFVIEK